MAQKLGNGGHSNEEYSTKTGKYVAASGYTKEELKKFVENGDFGQDYLDLYNTLDSDQKDAFIDEIANALKEQNTSEQLEEQFTALTETEYDDFSDAQIDMLPASATINGHTYTKQELLDAFNNYRGAGQVAFELQKAVRFLYQDGNLDRFYDYLGQSRRTAMYGSSPDRLSEKGIESWMERMELLTSLSVTPKSFRGYRYLDTNWLCSTFKNIMPSTWQIENDEYGYQKIKPGTESVDDMVSFLSNYIGCEIPEDGSFSSISCVKGNTHMGHHTGDKRKLIHMEIDVPENSGCYFGRYRRESEACLSNKTKYFLKEVSKNTFTDYYGNPQDEVLMIMGIQQ